MPRSKSIIGAPARPPSVRLILVAAPLFSFNAALMTLQVVINKLGARLAALVANLLWHLLHQVRLRRLDASKAARDCSLC